MNERSEAHLLLARQEQELNSFLARQAHRLSTVGFSWKDAPLFEITDSCIFPDFDAVQSGLYLTKSGGLFLYQLKRGKDRWDRRAIRGDDLRLVIDDVESAVSVVVEEFRSATGNLV